MTEDEAKDKLIDAMLENIRLQGEIEELTGRIQQMENEIYIYRSRVDRIRHHVKMAYDTMMELPEEDKIEVTP